MSLRDKVEGNELDLSLNQLTEVPVKELAAATKATHLDLTCNCLVTLPSDFATLTHLVKIDLSRNNLIELPHNFGNLINLQSLDLYGNQLTTVPVSFCRLKNLRWLDLKNNPLEPKLKAVAGNCLDEKECQLCAKKVVAYMQSIESDLEREKQKKLKDMREKEAIQRAKIEKELEEHRRQKKLEKERRKAESKARREEKMDQEKLETEKLSEFHDTEHEEDVTMHAKKGMHWCTMLLLCSLLMAAILVVFCAVKGFHFQDISVSNLKAATAESFEAFKELSSTCWSYIIPYIANLKSSILQSVHYTMLSVSNFASNIELFLSLYF